jgi:CofH subfamily radical SAM domain protein
VDKVWVMTDRAHEVGLEGWLSRAIIAPDTVGDRAWVQLLGADGDALEALCVSADQLRAERVGDDITYAVNRNFETAVVAGDRPLLAELVDEAWELGATEICMQGSLPLDLPGRAYLEVVRAISAQRPEIHVHAFRPAEVEDAARRTGLTPAAFLAQAREAGLGSVPGTGARILDDRIRAALTDGADISAARWIELISTAHRAGLRSTATMVYGHIESPADQIAHLQTLASIQDATGGFTELILMPIQPGQVPPRLAGQVRYADVRETRALHAVARLRLAGRIDHLQAAWPKLGLDQARQLLQGGADDVGGILLDGRRAPEAGPEAGTSLSVADLEALAGALDRGLRQRTTLYGDAAGVHAGTGG